MKYKQIVSKGHEGHPARAVTSTPEIGISFDSPQSSNITQCEAMASDSPRSMSQRQLSAMIDSSPYMAGQRKVSEGITVQRETRPQHTESNGARHIDKQPSAGNGLPENLKGGIEALSGISMDNVKVHYNSSQPAQLNALAHAQGNDIHLGPGQERHLPHEAWHIVQQAQGRVKPTMQMKEGTSINDDEDLEREADQMGEKALQVKHDGANTHRAATNSTDTVQRRIGFEIETGIPITEQTPNPDPLTQAAHPVLNIDAHPQTMAQSVRYGSLVISADHEGAHAATITEPFNQWSIVEAVTDPVNDTMGVAHFEATARLWLNRLINIKQSALASPPSQNLSGNYYVGLPSAQNYNNWDRIAPQVTAGIPLDQVSKVITAFPLAGTHSAYNATELAKAAPAKAMAVMQRLIEARPPMLHDGVDELRGLITLMMNYLTAGNDDHIAKVIYMKNRPANVFYKSKLSDVSNNIRNTSYGNQILNNDAARNTLRLLLLAESGRTAGDPLFKADPDPNHPQGVASNVTVTTWLTEVLDGTDDQIFDEMKNPWANEITPDAEDEVVIELRKIGYDLTHNNFALNDFNNGLLAYMKKVFIANKAVKTHED